MFLLEDDEFNRGGSACKAGQWGRQVQLGLNLALLGWVLGSRQGRAAGARLGFAGLGPRQVAVRAGQVGLAGRLAWLGSRLAGLARQVWQGSGVDRGRRGSAWLCWAESEAGGAVGAAGARLGFAGLGPRQVGQVGHVGRLAGFVGAVQAGGVGRQAGLAWQVGQVGQVGRLAGLAGQVGQAGSAGAAGAQLGFAGLNPRQATAVAAGAWLGFAGLGPRQVKQQAGRYGVRRQAGLAGQMGQVGHVGRLAGLAGQFGQAGAAGAAGARLGFAGLGPRQVGQHARQGSGLGFAGLGPRQVAVRGGLAGRSGQPGLGSALLGWVLGRWGWEAGWLGWADGAVWARRQAGRLGWAAGAAGAWLGFAGLGPRQVGQQGSGLGFAGLGPRQVAVRGGSAGRAGQPGLGSPLLCWVLGRWGWEAGWLGCADVAGRARRQAGRLGWAVCRQGQPGLGLALLDWVLGSMQGSALRFAGPGPRQVAVRAWLGFAGLGPRQVGAAGARLGFARLGPGQAGWGSQGREAGAWLGFAGLGPREAGRAGQMGLFENQNDQLTFSLKLFNSFVDQKDNCIVVEEDGDEDKFSDSDLIAEFNNVGVGQVRMGRLGRWGRSVVKGRADQLVPCWGWPVSGSKEQRGISPPWPCRHGLGVIYVDSKSTLSRLKNPFSTKPEQHLVLEILYLLRANILLQKITLAWRPGHKDIKENERVDNIAKRAAWNPAMDSLEAIKARTKFVADSPRRHQWQKSILDLEALLAGIVGELHTGHIGDYTPFPLILSSLQDAGTLSPA
ncbi:hypothetical protein PPACK8108_LOCUS14241 [Phakopsora pachyrhizi]|uniref:RNase H type-1 domain-containing protein n=1 Tax=Phakopsora pachyrhizi TaxID=170000 RepID=A0AAV0B488_PHAPC|nr:hypothetical protein PPACK8108_LOCUS14241 [Phakopsora pachyrhizi]